jgi:hypothetical protein
MIFMCDRTHLAVAPRSIDQHPHIHTHADSSVQDEYLLQALDRPQTYEINTAYL